MSFPCRFARFFHERGALCRDPARAQQGLSNRTRCLLNDCLPQFCMDQGVYKQKSKKSIYIILVFATLFSCSVVSFKGLEILSF